MDGNLLARAVVAFYPAFLFLAYGVSIVFAVSGLLDLFQDLRHWLRVGWRAWASRKWPRLTLERLEAREQQKVAILIPAWQEEEVISRTLRNACQTIRYRNYDIFVGTYPNDLATQREVDAVAAEFPQVHKVVSPVDGPTSKASNLNHIYRSLAEWEEKSGQRYEILVTHDSEDIIHPLSLLLFNYLIPRKDMIQIPVFPVAVPLRNFTHWTYADEFAENHTKLLEVRERSGGFVPSAGVGTAYSRRALDLVALRHDAQVFPPESLTEDYELGLRMRLAGIQAAFVAQRIPLPGAAKGTLDWVATQSLFPMDVRRAVRQKTRWNIGIVLQSWERDGWPGNWGVRWNLIQDRKVLVAAPAGFLAYFVLAYFILYEVLARFASFSLPPLIVKGTPLWYLVVVSSLFMAWRLLNRALAVRQVYGFWPAVTSIPRVIWGNYINFLAVLRAVKQYLGGRASGRQIAWDKTTHDFPTQLEVPQRPKASEEAPLGMNLQTQIRGIRADLASSDQERRLAAVRRVRRETARQLLPYLLALKDSSWRVRSELCRAFSFLRREQAIPYLEKAATDPDWTVRANAVKALSKMGDAGQEALLRILSGPDAYAREIALATLEQQGFIQLNVRRLKSTDPAQAEMGREFFRLLERFGPSSLACELLARSEGPSTPKESFARPAPRPLTERVPSNVQRERAREC